MESAENKPQPQLNNELAAPSKPTLSKTETIALLNQSIDRLEETIQKISQDSANMPSSQSIDNLLATTQELEAEVTSAKAEASTPIPVTPKVTGDRQSSINDLQQTTVNPAPRTKAKASKNTGLIVIGVTAIAIAIVTVFWLWQPQQFANLLPQAKPTPEPIEVVVAPEANIKTNIGTQPLETPLEETETVDNVGIVSDISAMDFPPEIEPVAEPIEDVVETVIPEELTSPGRPKNLKMVAIKPKLNFTPEQNLVAVLENKVSELIETYPQEFVREVRVDLPASSLLVRVTDSWYDLEELDRDSLGNEILERARAFNFQKLELKDNLGNLVARNPIIGDNIIILQNSRE